MQKTRASKSAQPAALASESAGAPTSEAAAAPTLRASKSEVRLAWATRDQAELPLPSATLERVEDCAAPVEVRLVRADAWALARALAAEGLEGKVDLVYLDPPFFSDADYVHEARHDGRADGRLTRSLAYEDRWTKKAGGLSAYLDMLAPRLEALARLVAKSGTFWVHLDWRASYLVRVLLDEIFGKDAFLNEIIWKRAPNLGRQATSGQFGRTLDTLLVYGGKDAKLVPPTRPERVAANAVRFDEEGRAFTTAPRGDYTDASIERLAAEGRVLRTASGKVYVKYFLTKDDEGEHFRERRVDALWTDVPPLRHASPSERTGYPTQKPLALLERVVRSGSPEGGLVVDAFAGSGTTGEAAFRVGRRAILGDASPVSIATSRARLVRAGARVSLCESVDIERAPAVEISAEAFRREAGIEVTLIAPVDPLAWAVDPAKEPLFPFRAAWSAARTLGKKTAPAPRTAKVESSSDKVSVRVYTDDGRVSETEVSVR